MTLDARFRVARGAFALDVDLSLPARGVTALFGPSGSGKTTLLRLIAGLDRDPAGRVSLAGEVWQAGATFVPPHRRALGYVFQEPSLFAHLDVRGNVTYGLRRVPAAARRVALEDAVAWLGLDGLLGRDPASLSGGERQRVAIARALLTSPRLLLMDEPLAALDAASKAEIVPYLERLHRALEIPVVYVSHALDEVARLADHLVVLERGRVAAEGPLIETLTRLDGPLSRAADAEAVVEATVTAHDERYALTSLACAGVEFTVAGPPLPVGTPVRIRVLARDVSLALERPSATSILNVLPARVAEVREDGPAQATVRLELGGGVAILARLTRRSVDALGVEPGKEVFAQVKSVAVLGP